jgi:hypothetical protein
VPLGVGEFTFFPLLHSWALAMEDLLFIFTYMIGFSLYLIKAVLNGRGDEIIDLAKTNLFR